MEDEKGLELQIGDSLQLQFVADENKRRHYSKVIGFLKGQSVLITTPRIDGNIMLVRENQLVIVRMLTGNSVVGFNTSVLRACLKPYAYLHLAYPKEMEHITVRKAQRVSTKLIASVETYQENNSRTSIPIIIEDISTTGSMISAETSLGETGEFVTISARISVGNVREYINIPAIIRNVRKFTTEEGTTKYSYGMEFQLLEQHEHFVLHGYVYEQLLENMKK